MASMKRWEPYRSPGQGWQKNNSKNKNRNFEEIFFQIFFSHGEKENFEEYSLILEYAELSFPILNNYSAKKRRPYPRATVVGSKDRISYFILINMAME
jgi:hypothetical protein